ncbi:MAG: hypothetical protein ACM3JD_18520 [Rudaea sp.]
MTHTLHRFGTEEDLQGDYVVFAMSAKGINEAGSASSLGRFLEIALRHNPNNAGDMKTGNLLTHSCDQILEGIQDVSIVHAVFTDEEKVAAVLREVAEADLGVSVVVSGLADRVQSCAHRAGLRRHTTEWSLGVWGRTDLLPDRQIMEVTTMCGHGMVAAELVRRKAQQIRRRLITPEAAAREIGRACVCGVFNLDRAARLLAAMAATPAHSPQPAAVGQTVA